MRHPSFHMDSKHPCDTIKTKSDWNLGKWWTESFKCIAKSSELGHKLLPEFTKLPEGEPNIFKYGPGGPNNWNCHRNSAFWEAPRSTVGALWGRFWGWLLVWEAWCSRWERPLGDHLPRGGAKNGYRAGERDMPDRDREGLQRWPPAFPGTRAGTSKVGFYWHIPWNFRM